MAGEFCQRRDDRGRRCFIAAEHHGPCVFERAREEQAPSTAEALIYERGGHVPTGLNGSLPGLEHGGASAATVASGRFQELLPAVREAVAATEARGPWVRPEDFRPTPETLAIWKSGGGTSTEVEAVERVRAGVPTPAAMLGEAVALIEWAQDIIRRTPRASGTSDVLASAALRSLDVGKHRMQGMIREDTGRVGLRQSPAVQAELKPASNSCWQCDAPLGTTEACLTCAAKRREGAQTASTCERCGTPRRPGGTNNTLCPNCAEEVELEEMADRREAGVGAGCDTGIAPSGGIAVSGGGPPAGSIMGTGGSDAT